MAEAYSDDETVKVHIDIFYCSLVISNSFSLKFLFREISIVSGTSYQFKVRDFHV